MDIEYKTGDPPEVHKCHRCLRTHDLREDCDQLDAIESIHDDYALLLAKKESQLSECLDAIVYHRKGSRGANPLTAGSWFLNILKRHGRVKPVEGEDLSKFRRPDV